MILDSDNSAIVSFVVDRLEEKMSELMERTEERRPMLKDAAIRNMNMREAIAKGKIHLFSEVEDAIEEPSHRIDLKTNGYVNERS